jgi:streptothricin acetyltransferase
VLEIFGKMLENNAEVAHPTILRPLELSDIPNLPQIRPTYQTSTRLTVEKTGSGLAVGWQLVEQPLSKPFDKGRLYDFDANAQDIIRERLLRPDDTYQRVAVYNERLVGLVELDIQYWNNTVSLANLMIDHDFRGQGLGRRLWFRALDFARQSDVRAIMIETQNTNIAACKFYVRMGCQLVGINDAQYTNNGYADDNEIALFWAYFLPT